MLQTFNVGKDEESSEDVTPEEYTKTYYDSDEAWDDAEKLVDEYKDEEGYFQVDVWEGEYETPEGEIINSEDVYDIFHMLTGTEGYQGHILLEVLTKVQTNYLYLKYKQQKLIQLNFPLVKRH